MAPKSIPKEEKRHTIVTAAMSVFARNGYHASRVREVAAEAGIGKGTIYEYFGSKEELLLALFDYMFQEFERLIPGVTNQNSSGFDLIMGSVDLMLANIADYAEFTPVFFETLGSRQLNMRLGLTELLDRWIRQLSADYARLIKKGQLDGSISKRVEPLAMARVLISMMDGIAMHLSLFKPTMAHFKRQSNEFRRIIQNSLQDGEK